MKIINSSGIYKVVYNTYYFYLERDNGKALKFPINNSSYFEISASHF